MRYKSSSGANANWEMLLPSTDIEVHEEYLELFFSTMAERQNIWVKKTLEKQAPPWTDDKFFRDYKFTNVYRELDRNSQWEINNIIKPKNIKPIDKVWMICFFRLMNEPKFFEFYKEEEGFKNALPLPSEFKKARFYACLTKYRKMGKNPYTSAYLINTACCPKEKRDKCYAFKIIPGVFDNYSDLYEVMQNATDPKQIIKKLMTMPAIAEFVSHEIYISFCYFERYADKAIMKFNQNDFTNVGPGASLGIRLIFPSTKSKDQEQRIYDLRDMAKAYLDKYDFQYLNYDKKTEKYYVSSEGELTVHSQEMWCCELSKYWKMLMGVGKQRGKYKFNF